MNNKVLIDPIIGKEFVKKVVPLVGKARQSIKIIVFDWRNYKSDVGSAVFKLNQSILGAKKRGVNVCVLLPPKNREMTWLNQFFKTKKLYDGKLIHAKMMIIDDEILVIGSHNYTYSGLELNVEFSVILAGKVGIQRFVEYFDNLF